MDSKNIKIITTLLFIILSFTAASGPPPPQHDDPELRKLLTEAINSTDGFDNQYDAEVWLVDMSTRMSRMVKDPERRMEILQNVHYEATRADLEPELVLSVMHVESLFQKYAISRVGARGLMQIMPFWLKEIGRPDDDLFDVKTNIRMGCTILKHYLKIEKGNLSRALGRYNGSLGKMKYPNKVYKAWRRYWYHRE